VGKHCKLKLKRADLYFLKNITIIPERTEGNSVLHRALLYLLTGNEFSPMGFVFLGERHNAYTLGLLLLAVESLSSGN
jgi:hypothetical protein